MILSVAGVKRHVEKSTSLGNAPAVPAVSLIGTAIGDPSRLYFDHLIGTGRTNLRQA
jgi:hypothetical protein